MSYELTKSDGTTLTELGDGVIDASSASIKFLGRNVVNYGEAQNENFLHLLENFANNTAPNRAITGQVWFDSSTGRLKVYNGSSWHQMPAVSYNTTATNQADGDLWWNTGLSKLYVKTAGGYVLVGPNSAASTAATLQTPRTINGVTFDGSANITISSTTTNSISTGTYLIGDTFNGSAATTWNVNVGNISSPEPFRVVARDSAGDIWYTVGHGVSTSAKFADLAEKYLSDKSYDPGTVVVIGGDKEITMCQVGDRAVGVVSAKPGYLMNCDLLGGVPVALKGRVPVNISKPVRKGDRLVSGPNGTAIPGGPVDCFAIALSDSDSGSVEALIL